MCGNASFKNFVDSDIYPIEIKIHKFGGSVSAPEKKRGNKQRGIMKWLSVRPGDPKFVEILEDAEEKIKEKIILLLEKLKIKQILEMMTFPKMEVESKVVKHQEIETVGESW